MRSGEWGAVGAQRAQRHARLTCRHAIDSEEFVQKKIDAQMAEARQRSKRKDKRGTACSVRMLCFVRLCEQLINVGQGFVED